MLRRVACVDIPELPLQVLLRAHPEWRDAPVAVVAEERPEAPLLWINRHARHMQLRTGMRFGSAKSLVNELQAGAVSAHDIESTVASLVRDLQTFSPHVERDPVISGVFYVDPSGLSHLYGGEVCWARCVQRYLQGLRYYAALCIAHGRTLTYAISRITRGVRVIDSVEESLRVAGEVPIDRMHVDPKLRDALAKIGLSTLGDLTSVGADQLGRRFGAQAARLARVARGEETLPLCAEPQLDTPRTEVEIEPADADVARLCFAIKRALDPLIEDVRQRGQSIRALWLRLKLERHLESVQRLEPSTPTRDATLLLELLRLRLSAISLAAPVCLVVLEAEMVDATPGQLPMFAVKRDLAAGDRALARLRASFGPEVVCRAVLQDAHLPEAQFRWTNFGRLRLPHATDAAEQLSPVVRRFFHKPEPLSGHVDFSGMNPVLHMRDRALSLIGPYRIHGGWWVREIARDY